MVHTCSKCGIKKDESNFNKKTRKYKDKVYTYMSSYCIDCEKVYNHEYYMKCTKNKRKEMRHGKK